MNFTQKQIEKINELLIEGYVQHPEIPNLFYCDDFLFAVMTNGNCEAIN